MLRYFLVALFYFPAMILIVDSALFIVAEHNGYKPTLHYASISTGLGCGISPAIQSLRSQFPNEINNNLPTTALLNYQGLKNEMRRDDIMMVSFALALLLSIATVAFVIIFFSGKKINSFPKLLLIVVAGCWFSQPLKLLQATFGYTCGAWQIPIAEWLHLPSYSILITLSIIAILISAVIFFKIIPKVERIKFILGSVTGSAVELAAWMLVIGPFILP